MITPEHERAQASTGPGFADAVTFAWGDRPAGLYGLARLGLAGTGPARTASALAVVFRDREPIAATARDDVEASAQADFSDLEAGGLHATVGAPLREWTLAFDGGDAGFELTFDALGTPAELDPAEPVARAGGMVGYEQLCRVYGTVSAGGSRHTVHCLGQRSHLWGEPDWARIEATRTVTAWLDDGTGVSLTGVRPRGADGHDREVTWAALLDAAGNVHVDDPRLSTTYDRDGRQRRAGMELWVGDTDYAVRAAGEILCGSTFDLGELQLDCAFFGWHLDGREGVGRYDVVRRADATGRAPGDQFSEPSRSQQ